MINPVIELSAGQHAGRFRKKRIHCLEISSLRSSKLFITLLLLQGTPTPGQEEEELLGNRISPAVGWLALCLSTENLKGVNLSLAEFNV